MLFKKNNHAWSNVELSYTTISVFPIKNSRDLADILGTKNSNCQSTPVYCNHSTPVNTIQRVKIVIC